MLGAIPVTPAGLGVIDSITPVLLVGFGLTRSVATLGVLAWRLVNFWLPIPTGAAAYISLKVPRGAGLEVMRRSLSEMTARGAHAKQPSEPAPADHAEPPPADHAEPPPADHAEPPPADHAEPPPADHAEPPPADHAEPPPADHAEPPPADHAEPPPADDSPPGPHS